MGNDLHPSFQDCIVTQYSMIYELTISRKTLKVFHFRHEVGIKSPKAKYSMVGETLRQIIPSHVQCSVGCGGRACRYENPSRWREDQQAVKGLYSSWITENILAMARPSTQIIQKYNIIGQFQRCGLRTIINLQSPGEHASCGNPLEPQSGFTYRPEAFMEMGIYFYNFEWKDYGVASLTTILDMVKVMSFALQEGKIAVHCHAGLGRTGVLLACYLVFAARMNADQAILFVRAKRPNSIQTRGQLLCVREFAQLLVPLRNVFSCVEPKGSAITLSQFLIHQRHLLHGYEARRFKNIPRLVQLICKLLLDIADSQQAIEKQVLVIPDLEAQVEKMSKEVIQHLDTEMTGKGVPHLPVPDFTAIQTSEFYVTRSLSYSDSELCRLKSDLKVLDSQLSGLAITSHSSSYNNMDEVYLSSLLLERRNFYSSTSSVWEERLFRQRHFLKDAQRSNSLDMPCNSRKDEEQSLEVPFITVQTKLMRDNKHLLVAQALSVDMEEEGEKYGKEIAHWQKELNSREDAWERLCMEQDPFVLSGLMWSWLEQLKEPIISKNDVETMDKNNHNPSNVFDSLDKGPKQTLICVLDCFSNLMTIQENVESAFLNQTIKAFTKMKKDSEHGKIVYSSMRTILTLVLQGMRMKAKDSRLPGYSE